MSDNTNETAEEFEGAPEDTDVVDLSEFSFEELETLHAGLVEQYSTARESGVIEVDGEPVELSSDGQGYTSAVVEIADAIEFVAGEMEARIAAEELDAVVLESVELASNFGARMKAARAKKDTGPNDEADAEDVADKGADEATEGDVGTKKKVAAAADEVIEEAVAEEVAVEAAAEEAEVVVEETAEVASSEDLAASNTEDTTTATKEATVTAASTQLSPAGLPSDRPADVELENVITASADIPGFAAGQTLNGIKDVAKAFMNKRPRIGGTDPGNDGYRYHVATIHGNFSEERTLTDDAQSNMRKIEAITAPEAITASGGFCAPLTPYYNLQTFGETPEPVRDSLPNFKADRGGITFMPPPRLTDVASGVVRRTTAAQDAAGYTNQTPAGTTAPKPCLHVTCLPNQSVVVEAISRCLTFGNLGARTFPEQVEAWIKLSLVQFARFSETEILDSLSLSSTPINAANVYSVTNSWLEQVSRALAAFRYRHRMSKATPFRLIAPQWVREAVKSDVAFQGPGDGLHRYEVSDSEVDGWFAARGINPTWHLDNSTNMGVPFAAQAAGALTAWPTRFDWYLFPEGSFLYLDAGSIDLGLVRDSILNSQNDYQIWAERFQGVAFVGVESYRVVSKICVTGTAAALTAPASCTGS